MTFETYRNKKYHTTEYNNFNAYIINEGYKTQRPIVLREYLERNGKKGYYYLEDLFKWHLKFTSKINKEL